MRTTLLLSFVLVLTACGERSLSHPEEILQRIRLEYPSVLGYMRFSPEAASILAPAESSSSLGLNPFSRSLESFFPLIRKIAPLCREGSYIRIALLDPQIFGGSAALHFEPREAGSLVKLLEADDRFERTENSQPPEFSCREGHDLMIRLLWMARMAGIDAPTEAMEPMDRIIVDETPEGVLVLPSPDARGDFLRFLEDTDYLRPWGEASLVVNLEIIRFARAYAELIRQFNRSFAEALMRVERMTEVSDALLKFGRSLPKLMLEWTKALEGIRFTSHHPVSGGPELAIIAAEGGFLDESFSSMRGDAPDLIGLVPEGAVVQMNFDPVGLACMRERGLEFFAEITECAVQDPHALARSMAHDAGRYVAGLSWTLDGIHLVFMTALDGDAIGRETVLDLFLNLILPEGGLRYEKAEDIHWCKLPSIDYLPSVFLEKGSEPDLHVTTIQVGEDLKPGALTRKYFRLARMGAGRLRGLPEKAPLYLKFSVPPLPGIEKIVPSAIMGYGQVEENRLTIKFMN